MVTEKFYLESCDCVEINNSVNSKNKLIVFTPHQLDSLQGKSCIPYHSFISEVVPVGCICNHPTNFSEKICKLFKDNSDINYWISPSNMPISCFLSIVDTWKHYAKENSIIGIFVPNGIIYRRKLKLVWTANINGYHTLNRPSKIKNIVWYPTLARDENELKPVLLRFRISEIFPLTDILNKEGIFTNFDTNQHISFFDNSKIRTEKIMYINQKTPHETFEYLIKSIEHLPRKPEVNTPLVSPGGEPINYLAISLAAVVTNTNLLVDPEETFREKLTKELLILICED